MTGQVTAYVSQMVTPDHMTCQVTFSWSHVGKGSCYEGRFVTAAQQLVFSGLVGSGFLTILGPTGPQPVAKKVKFLATAIATAHN